MQNSKFLEIAKIASSIYYTCCANLSRKVSFTRPSHFTGYGRILEVLDKSTAPKTHWTIQVGLGLTPSSSYLTYADLTSAGLAHASHKGYQITSLGKAYVKAWHDSER